LGALQFRVPTFSGKDITTQPKSLRIGFTKKRVFLIKEKNLQAFEGNMKEKSRTKTVYTKIRHP
jgi:GH43 family beta-xylosidase